MIFLGLPSHAPAEVFPGLPRTILLDVHQEGDVQYSVAIYSTQQSVEAQWNCECVSVAEEEHVLLCSLLKERIRSSD